MNYKFIILLMFFFAINIDAKESIVYQVQQDKYVGTFIEKKIESSPFIFESYDIENVEVLYFFSYDCLKCYQLYPYINFWEKNLKYLNINFKRIPVSKYNKNKSLSKLFFARKHLGFNIKLDNEIFKGIQQGHFSIFSDNGIKKFFDKYIKHDHEKLNKILTSEKVDNKISLSNEILSSIGEYSLPLIVINKENKRFIIRSEDNVEPTEFIISLNKTMKIEKK